MNSDALLASLAFFLTYVLHSTVLLGGVWLLTRTRAVRSLATENGLWKAALVGGVLTAGLQSGLGFEPWGGFLPMQSPKEVLASQPAHPSVLPASAHRPRSAEPAAPLAAVVGQWALASREAALASPEAQVPPPAVALAEGRRARHDATPARSLPPVARTATRATELRRPSTAAARTTRTTPVPAPLTSSAVTLLLAFGLWLALAGFGVARFVGLRFELRRMLADREPVVDTSLLALLERLRRGSGLKRQVRLSSSARIAGPIALGRNEICLPPRAVTDLEPMRQEAMLAHEVAHLVRRDPLWLNICAAFEAVFFFQPLNRMARRRMQETAEFLCDDWAVSRTGRGLVLARCLAQVAAWIEESARPLPVASMARPDSTLVQRVRRLAEGGHAPVVSRPVRAALLGVAIVGAVSCSVPGISASGRAGFLARLVAAWNAASDVAPASTSQSASTQGNESEVTLVVEDGEVVGVRVGGREIDVEEAVEAAGSQAVRDDSGRTMIVLSVQSDDRASDPTTAERRSVSSSGDDCEEHEWEEPAEWEEAEWEGAEWGEPEWDHEDEWEEDADWDHWDEGEADEWEDEPRWDSRSLRDLSARMQKLESDYVSKHRQLKSAWDQRQQQYERECQQTVDQTDRQLQTWVSKWNQAHHSAQSKRQSDWQVRSQRANQDLAKLQQQHRGDPEEYREHFEEWRASYEEALEEYEEQRQDWEDETRREYDDALKEYDHLRHELKDEWMDGREELADERLEAFEDLEDWFADAYWELRDAFDQSISDREGRPCDHGCKRECSNGCTHPEDPVRPPAEDPGPEQTCPEPSEPSSQSDAVVRRDGQQRSAAMRVAGGR